MSNSGDSIQISRVKGDALLTHRVGPNERPSIHPLLAPDGRGVLTEDRPSHHPWQRGLSGFNLVNGIGFWRDRPEDGIFNPGLSEGPVVDGNTCRWILDVDWIAPNGDCLLLERQAWSLVDDGATYDLDLNWSLTAREEVTIGQFMAGGLFLRMPWRAESGGIALNSEGQANGTAERRRARWVAVAMPIEGRNDWGGVAIMDHPANPGHPVTWRVDNELGISPSRVIAGSWTIAAGDTECYQFRLSVFTGQHSPEVIEQRWVAFAATGAGPERH